MVDYWFWVVVCVKFRYLFFDVFKVFVKFFLLGVRVENLEIRCCICVIVCCLLLVVVVVG